MGAIGRLECRWEDNMWMDITETLWEVRGWIDLAQDKDQWRVFVRTYWTLGFHKKWEIYCLSEGHLVSQDGLCSIDIDVGEVCIYPMYHVFVCCAVFRKLIEFYCQLILKRYKRKLHPQNNFKSRPPSSVEIKNVWSWTSTPHTSLWRGC
jgi:hypothetical protein